MDFSVLKKVLDGIIEKGNTPCVDCLVYRDHQIIFRYFNGLSDVERQRKIEGNELYLIYSMTKMLTCTAALQLFEQGKFSLEDKLSDYIPEFEKMKIAPDASDGAGDGYAKNPIKMIHLFTMSAGLDYETHDEAINSALAQGKESTLDLVKAMASKRLCFEPGTRFRYSLCHDLLGAVVEVLSGKKLGDYMKENIFLPLGMKNTRFDIPEDEEYLDRFAAQYSPDKNGVLHRRSINCWRDFPSEYQSGGAGLTSCTEDYALFLDAIACGGVGKNGNRILSEETVRLMGTNHLKGQQLEDYHNLKGGGYGYGLGVRTHMDKAESGSLSPLGEFGWDGAAGGFSMVDTQNRLSLTYFQHSHKWNGEMQNEMRNALYSCINKD